MSSRPRVSVVIPLYNSADCVAKLFDELDRIEVEGGHEIVLVNDGSSDETAAKVRELLPGVKAPLTFVDLRRNFGEHNAVLTGYRYSRGDFVVNIDDDLQNPVDEALRLVEHADSKDYDVVYSAFETKQHSDFRNLGSWLTNKAADFLIDKPRGLYLSSFRCVRGDLARQIASQERPYPYIDGTIFQHTHRVGTLLVEHRGRVAGESSYTLRRLVRLWLSMFLSFSTMPLRLATLLGLVFATLGLLGVLGVLIEILFFDIANVPGWASLMIVLFVFSGVQLFVLGLLGEYIGRMYVTLSGRPQASLRSVTQRNQGDADD